MWVGTALTLPLLRYAPFSPRARGCVFGLRLLARFQSIAEVKSRFLLHMASQTPNFSGRSGRSEFGEGRAQDGQWRGGRRSKGGQMDKIDALGRLLTRILRHIASELNLEMGSDGYVRVHDLLNLDTKTFANVPLRAHTVDEIREGQTKALPSFNGTPFGIFEGGGTHNCELRGVEICGRSYLAVRRDNKQRFSLKENDGELLIRANQGHTVVSVKSQSLLKPILSADEVSVCVHGTYKKNLEAILQVGLKRMSRIHIHFSCGLPNDGVVSGMRRDVNVLIFLNLAKALEEGMKFYISDNKVILTEGFDGVVPVKYFGKIETWPGRQSIPY